MEIGLFLFKFLFCVVCWTAVTSMLGWIYSNLCVKLKRDDIRAPAAFMLATAIGILIGSTMAGLSSADGFIAVPLVAAPAVLISCLVGAIIGLFFKDRPMPRRKRSD